MNSLMMMNSNIDNKVETTVIKHRMSSAHSSSPGRQSSGYDNDKSHPPALGRPHKRACSPRLTMIAVFLVLAGVYLAVPLVFQPSVPGGGLTPRRPAPPSSANDLDAQLSRIQEKIRRQSGNLAALADALQTRDQSLQKIRDQIGQTEAEVKHMLEEAEAANHHTEPASQGVVKKLFTRLEPTSITCFGSTKEDRICRFRNLYYLPKRDVYVAALSHESVLHNVPLDRRPALLELTTIVDHSVFYWDFEEIACDAIRDVVVNVVEKRTFMFSRFHLGNIMHSLHDDFLGLYHVIRRFSPGVTSNNLPGYAAFSLNHFIQFSDKNPSGPYGHLFSMLSDHPLRYHSELHRDGDRITCFEDIYVGQTKMTTWYQYGFAIPQGPLAKDVNGNHIRLAARFIEHRLGQADEQQLSFSNQKLPVDTLAIFSRRQNRLMLNEDTLLAELASRLKLKPQFVRLEDMDFREQVAVMKRTKVAFGMHGSALIMAMFMPPGSVLVEGYPFAVPANNYTPYKTLVRLPGMNIAYRAWSNTHEDANVPHPDNDMYTGGINQLSEDERAHVLETKSVPEHICCSNPYWLFRIYQDTVVNIDEVHDLIVDGMHEVDEKDYINSKFAPSILPAKIDANSITCAALISEGRLMSILVTWNTPWNGAKPDSYGVWEHVAYNEYLTDVNSAHIQNPLYQNNTKLGLWVRTYTAGIKSPYSDRHDCTISWEN
eukprot:Partr_v1_DN27451_c0_g1_i2_m71638 putative Glycosyltransferase